MTSSTIPGLTRRLMLGGASLLFGTPVWATTAIAAELSEGALLSPSELKASIDTARTNIQRLMAAAGVPGISVALVYRGQSLWVEGLGVTDRQGAPVDDRTIFSIESISKNFTATAVMLAVQDGKLNLDAPITTYLPEFTVHSRFEVAPQRKMTLKLLLCHRAGFTHEAPLGNNFAPDCPSFEAHIESISQTWLRYPVAQRYCYSNLGVDLAGFILQRVTGLDYAEYLREKLFEPLGMADSTADQGVYAARPNRAIGHVPGYSSVPLRVPMIPSGGIYTSAGDMAKYAAFHLGKGMFNGREVLRRELWEEMHACPFGGANSLGVSRIDLPYERGVAHVFDHDGGGFGFEATLNYCPQTQIAWAAMLNGSTHEPTPDPHAFSFPTEIVRKAYGVLGNSVPRSAPAPAKPTSMSDGDRANIAGTYLGRDGVHVLRSGDRPAQFEWGSEKLQFVSPTRAQVIDGVSVSQEVAYHPATNHEVAYFEWPDGSCFDRSDGPEDRPGPVKEEFDRLLGTYEMRTWGKPSRIVLSKRNGYLYLGDYRLSEYQRGLFFTADGEAVDFRSDTPTFRNIALVKV